MPSVDCIAVQKSSFNPSGNVHPMTDSEIVAMEAELRAAQLSSDVAALDELIDDDLLFTGPDGELASKADDLAAHREGLLRLSAHEPEEMRIRRVGEDVAVVALRTRLAGVFAGMPFSGTYRYTRVWVRSGGRWRIVAGHVSEVPSKDSSNAP
jgi:ketosteroid isomerase-like protein